MRILLLNQVFWPDVAATAQHAHDLGKHLVAHGHEVEVIASRAIYGEKGARLAKRDAVDGIEVHRVGRSFFGKAGLIGRLIDFAIFYVAAWWKSMRVKRPDVVVCFTTPPFIVLVGLMMRLLRGTKCVYWVMDLYPDVLTASGVLKKGGVVNGVLERVSRWCLRRSDRTVVLGRCMKERVLAKGAPAERVVEIGVWSDTEEVKESATNAYRAEWGLAGEFVVMYSGNFGIVHDVETMCAAAKELEGRHRAHAAEQQSTTMAGKASRAHDDPQAEAGADERGQTMGRGATRNVALPSQIRFVFVGGGKRKGEVERFVKEHELGCRLEPYQPRERLDALLTSPDVHLVSLKNGFEGVVVPSKLFGVMAAGRAVVFIGPRGSEVARVIEDEGCGFVVETGDVEGLIAAIERLARDRELCRAMGERARTAARAKYDQRHRCEAWRRMLEEMV